MQHLFLGMSIVYLRASMVHLNRLLVSSAGMLRFADRDSLTELLRPANVPSSGIVAFEKLVLVACCNLGLRRRPRVRRSEVMKLIKMDVTPE